MMLDRKKLRVLYRILLILIIFAISINLIRYVLSKYKSSGESTGNIEVAYYLLEDTEISDTIALKSLVPGDVITHKFSISNFKDGKIAEVAMEYDLKINATTNLPLTYKLTVNENDPNKSVTTHTDIIQYQDDYGTWFKKFEFTKEFLLQGTNNIFTSYEQTHNYELEITFPNTENSSKYQDVIEYLEININSRQIN